MHAMDLKKLPDMFQVQKLYFTRVKEKGNEYDQKGPNFRKIHTDLVFLVKITKELLVKPA